MPLHCPRCQTILDVFTRHGGPKSVPLAADMCLACGGVWLDGGEAAMAYPGLSALEDRRGDVMAVGVVGGILACPRCSMPAIEVPFFDVQLDMCTECYGVWIDGAELGALSRTMDRGDGLPVPLEIIGGYRTAAAGVLTKHLATCVACEKQVPFRATHASSKGALCDACAKQMVADEAHARDGGDDAGDDYVVPMQSGFWGFVCDVGSAIGALLDAVPRCTNCKRRSSSQCRCDGPR